MDPRTATFQQHRPRLYGIAYRMLGSRADAEDMLQEAYLRWHSSDTERVQNPQAWLTTITTRLCIDRLRAGRADYVGPWLPEPLVDEEVPPPDRAAELASDLSVAFLVVLERLAPEERAAFLLHDVFDGDYADIARILGRNESSCRQIVHRARERVRQDRPRFQVSEAAHSRLLEKFVAALKAEDHDALLSLFAADASWTSDGGGKAKAARKMVRGAGRVARFAIGIWRRYLRHVSQRVVPVNGQPGLLMCVDGRPTLVMSIDTDGVRILAVYTVLNPDKLERVASSLSCH
jgi:RNA polymerase sigma-70 factor (ECF subfamily)